MRWSRTLPAVVAALIGSIAFARPAAAAGGIGFIGLVVPHGFRLGAGPDHRYLLPVSSTSSVGFGRIPWVVRG